MANWSTGFYDPTPARRKPKWQDIFGIPLSEQDKALQTTGSQGIVQSVKNLQWQPLAQQAAGVQAQPTQLEQARVAATPAQPTTNLSSMRMASALAAQPEQPAAMASRTAASSSAESKESLINSLRNTATDMGSIKNRFPLVYIAMNGGGIPLWQWGAYQKQLEQYQLEMGLYTETAGLAGGYTQSAQDIAPSANYDTEIFGEGTTAQTQPTPRQMTLTPTQQSNVDGNANWIKNNYDNWIKNYGRENYTLDENLMYLIKEANWMGGTSWTGQTLSDSEKLQLLKQAMNQPFGESGYNSETTVDLLQDFRQQNPPPGTTPATTPATTTPTQGFVSPTLSTTGQTTTTQTGTSAYAPPAMPTPPSPMGYSGESYLETQRRLNEATQYDYEQARKTALAEMNRDMMRRGISGSGLETETRLDLEGRLERARAAAESSNALQVQQLAQQQAQYVNDQMENRWKYVNDLSNRQAEFGAQMSNDEFKFIEDLKNDQWKYMKDMVQRQIEFSTMTEIDKAKFIQQMKNWETEFLEGQRQFNMTLEAGDRARAQQIAMENQNRKSQWWQTLVEVGAMIWRTERMG